MSLANASVWTALSTFIKIGAGLLVVKVLAVAFGPDEMGRAGNFRQLVTVLGAIQAYMVHLYRLFRAVQWCVPTLFQEKMSNLIHVLGSDIPHHNLTVLRFFNDTLAAICPPAQTRRFMVVAPDGAPFSGCSRLDIERFDSKRALTKALVRRATGRTLFSARPI